MKRLRERVELLHDRALRLVRLAQHSVQRRYHRHLHVAQQSQQMTSGRPAVDAKLMLDRDDLDVINVQEIRRAPVGVEFLLVDFKTNARRIIVTFGAIVDCSHDAFAIRILGCDRLANVRGKRRDAALPGHVVSQESDAVDLGSGHDGLEFPASARYKLTVEFIVIGDRSSRQGRDAVLLRLLAGLSHDSGEYPHEM